MEHGRGREVGSASSPAAISIKTEAFPKQNQNQNHNGISQSHSHSHHELLKRKRNSVDLDNNNNSPNSAHEGEDNEDVERRRQPGVKRACNECRQQKDPFSSCSRCNRLKLQCKIESNFKRVGKRSKHAEMEKQIERLKRSLNRAQAQGYTVEDDEDTIESPINSNGPYSTISSSSAQAFRNNDDAVSSLLHLKQRTYSFPAPAYSHQLEDVGVTREVEKQLFDEYFAYYHQFIPFLTPAQDPELYFQQSPLLYWAIISVAARRTQLVNNLLTKLAGPISRLLWKVVGDVPGNHHAIKALCLLCTWPLPTSTTSTDPTHILGGVMMKTATNIGLHRPSHAQDFSRTRIALNHNQLHDRVVTWATCNIVAQTLGTGYGQPASTLYDWTLALKADNANSPFALSPELDARIQIEKFCDKVSKECYSNQTDPIGLSGDEIRNHLTRVFRREHNDQAHLANKIDVSPLVELWHKAAGVHLRLSAFFDSSTAEGYLDDLTGLWRATVAFLDCVFRIEDATRFLQYGTNYLCQMIVAAGFVLMKLLSSFFAEDIFYERGRRLFHRANTAVRSMSIVHNDLAYRLGELMAQMWRGMDLDNKNSTSRGGQVDNSLQLKVRCRHSMSLVFDSVWRWREEYQAKGQGTLEASAIKIDPHPEAGEAMRSTQPLDNTLMPSSHEISSNLSINGIPALQDSSIQNGFPDSNYEVFDPLNWMLDGLVDFPYSYAAVQGLEAQGLS